MLEDSIFYPKSIAIVGASSNSASPGSRNFLVPLLHFGYKGKIYPINPNHSEVMGLKAYPSLKDIPEPVDYVICAVSAPLTPPVMQDCVDAGVKLVSFYTAGFSDTGEEEDINLEKQLLEIVRGSRTRILGPNCLGIHTPAVRVIYEMEGRTDSGHVGVYSQSGGNTRDIIAMGGVRGVKFSKAVSCGNAIDLNECDFIEYFTGDAETEVIAAYVEGVKQPQRFSQALEQATKVKPVIMLKGGQTEAGRGAVASHTGSLAGSREVWDALCKQRGVVQVDNLDELTDAMLAFSYMKPPKGRRVAFMGIGGGLCVQSADDCENANLIVPPFPEDVRKGLREINPKAGTSIRNPLDASQETYSNPDLFFRTVDLISGCDDIDILMIMLSSRYAILRKSVEAWHQQIDSVIEMGKKIDKPVAAILLGGNTSEAYNLILDAQERFSQSGVATFPTAGRAAKAIDLLINYHENRLHG